MKICSSSKRVYLDFKEGRTECGPLVNDLEEGEFCFFSSFPRVLVEQRHDGLRGRNRKKSGRDKHFTLRVGSIQECVVVCWTLLP